MKSTANGTEHNCPTVFVSDRPSSIDSFETNRAYSRIVNALVEIVRAPKNDGMSIGVEGSWGAGKSTLINLLDAKLGQSESERLIVFDAWAHEGDPLRLTFLETLVDGLKVKGWVDKDHWEEQLDIIAQRKEIKDTASDYGLTWFDGVIAFVFFLIPIGVALLNSAFRNEITVDPAQPIAWKLILGILCCIAAPVLMILRLPLKWVWRKLKRLRTGAGKTLQERNLKSTKQTFLALLLNRTLSTGKTVVVKSPEPTSVEFEKQFKRLMGDALNSHPERRVVLVIDNLDRVQADRAIAIWSTLQTFLQHRHSNPPNWLKQLYTVVLYDPARISETPIADKKVQAIEEAAQQETQWKTEHEMKQEMEREGSILDKSFQIRFEVPPPILSDWREYLLKLLRDSLPKHEAEYHEIYRVLAINRYKRPPTIRELKVFVNQICAFHLQWQDKFPLKHVAYYVALKRRQKNVVEGLLDGNLPEHQYTAILGERVQDSLVALSFNVEPDIAYQFLLATPIQEALTDLTGDKLKERANRSENGFWEVLEHTISSEWAGDQSEKVSRAILAIERSGLLKTTQRPESYSVQSSLSRIAFEMKLWRPFTIDTAQSLAVLCQWRHDDNSRNDLQGDIVNLLEAITEGIFDPNSFTRTIVTVPDWLTALNVLIGQIRKLGIGEVGSNVVVKKIKGRFTVSRHLEGTEIRRLLEVLLDLRTSETSAGETLTELAEGGQIFHYFNHVHLASSEHDACSWCILALFTSSIPFPPNIANAQNGYDTLLTLFNQPQAADVREFSKLLLRYRDTFALDIAGRDPRAENFLTECLKHISNTSDSELFFTDQLIFSNWRFIIQRLSGDLSIVRNPRLVERIRSKGFGTEYGQLYGSMVEAEHFESSTFRDWCQVNLKRLTATQWESDLRGDWGLIKLGQAVQERGTFLELGEPIQNIIVTSVEKLLRHPDSNELEFLLNHSVLVEFLGAEPRQSACLQIYKMVKQADGKFPTDFLTKYGKFIAEVTMVDRQSVAMIFNPILENRKSEGINWLMRILVEKKTLFEEKNAPVTIFKLAIVSALSQPEDSMTPFILKLARVIGFTNLKDSLPSPPWTVETLGESLYKFIAKQGGYFDPEVEPPQHRPALGALGVEESN